MLYLTKLYIELVLEYPKWIFIIDILLSIIPICMFLLLLIGFINFKRDE